MLDENALKAILSDLEDKKTLAQMELNEEKIDYNDLLTQIRMLAQFGAGIDRYWEIATFDQRRDILGSMFTNVPTYKNYELTNMEISPLYEALRDISKNHVLNGRGGRTTATIEILSVSVVLRTRTRDVVTVLAPCTQQLRLPNTTCLPT